MPETLAIPSTGRAPAQSSLVAAGLFGLVLLLLFYATTSSMVAIWVRSETFAHGFLILPISLWLVWHERERWQGIAARPAPWVALLILPPGFAWLLAWLVDVLVVQQLALVAMVVVGAWAVLGHRLAKTLAFPLLFLFFAVPLGEALVPPMMEFTATSTVWMIKQTGVPVYREGLYFSLPSGNWSVVEACSGVRYIIASVTLGVLYAYLTYRSLWRRALFVLVSAVVPIFANTVRAYIIVMLGHLSDMKIATGVDHLVYGWVFFGLVIFVLFWLGSFFREDQAAAAAGVIGQMHTGNGGAAPGSRLIAASALALCVAGIWPLLAFTLQAGNEHQQHARPAAPAAGGDWNVRAEAPWQWQPAAAVDGQVAAFYRRQWQDIALYIQYVDSATAGGEVVGSSRGFVGADSPLRLVGLDKVKVRLGETAVVVDQALLRRAGGQLLAWSWYRIGNSYTANDYEAKFREAWASLGFGAAGSYRIVLVTPVQIDLGATQTVLQDFLNEHSGSLDAALGPEQQGIP